jgi:hypothetical protein
MKLSAFIDQHKIKLTSCVQVDRNPHMDAPDMYHYKMVLTRLRRNSRGYARFTSYFSTGFGWDREPTAEDLLDCVASDAASVENTGPFEEWASELGMDPDSRKAEQAYKAVCLQKEKIKQFLGEEAYSQLLWHVDRS